jgi:hypothetical protein
MNWLLGIVTKNPAVLAYIAAAAFAAGIAAGGVTAWKYQGALKDAAVSKYNAFVGETKTLGDAALKDKALIEAQHKTNLEVARNEYNDSLPQVRNDAVRNYLATHPRMPNNKNTSGGTLLGSPGSAKGTDAASQEQSTALCEPDTAFIQDAADDAKKIGSWQEWAILNKFPIQ